MNHILISSQDCTLSDDDALEFIAVVIRRGRGDNGEYSDTLFTEGPYPSASSVQVMACRNKKSDSFIISGYGRRLNPDYRIVCLNTGTTFGQERDEPEPLPPKNMEAVEPEFIESPGVHNAKKIALATIAVWVVAIAFSLYLSR